LSRLARVLCPTQFAQECRAAALFIGLAVLAAALSALSLLAQDRATQAMGMDMGNANPARALLLNQASGTSVNPASAPRPGFHWRAGRWNFMLHGEAFLSDVQQTGPRGGDKFFSGNWFMGMAEHPAGKGHFLIRAMLSLDPASVTHRRYPELFQTGETIFGLPLVDGQHPHDLFMELSVQYARPIGRQTVVSLYLAPVGDPALGPVAFPHRISASELPQAPLGHHLQDSSHIANEVVTAGLHFSKLGIEASGFHGAEPNEQRWKIDRGSIDSWAARFVLTPAPNWSAQVSAGRLHHPEALEPGDTIRSTASLSYQRPFDGGDWSTSLVWGRNHKTVQKRNLNSYLIEFLLRFRTRNYLTGRIEWLDRDELFAAQPVIQQQLANAGASVVRVAAYTLGYTRDIGLLPGLDTGLGGNFTRYTVPAVIQPYYGQHPASFYLLFRLRLKGPADSSMHHHVN
jgi:hypothetical protein